MRWPAVGRTVVVCFVVGRHQVPNTTLAVLDAEADEKRDLLFLPHITDGCVSMVSVGKAHAFWVAAARLTRRHRQLASDAPMIAKADDDSFVHVPLLLKALERARCLHTPRVYLGAFAFVGYQPRGFLNCGFAWGGGGAYEKYGCASRGAHPPFPFALGQLQALSAGAAAALAASTDARAFAAAAEDTPRTNANEDAALGFMMSRVPRLSYVNLPRGVWHNLGCWPTSGLYRPARANDSLVVHRIMSIAALRYVWGVVHDGAPPDVLECEHATYKGKAGEPTMPISDARWRRWCESMSAREPVSPTWATNAYGAKNPQAVPVSHPSFKRDPSNAAPPEMTTNWATESYAGRNAQAVPVSHPAFDAKAAATRDAAPDVTCGWATAPYAGRNAQAEPVSHPNFNRAPGGAAAAPVVTCGWATEAYAGRNAQAEPVSHPNFDRSKANYDPGLEMTTGWATGASGGSARTISRNPQAQPRSAR